MARKKQSIEQIIHEFREAEVLLTQVSAVAGVCRSPDITEVIYHRWRIQLEWDDVRL